MLALESSESAPPILIECIEFILLMFLLGWVGRYTLMPVHMQSMFHVKELAEWEKDDGSSYGAHRDYPHLGCCILYVASFLVSRTTLCFAKTGSGQTNSREIEQN